MYRNKSLMRDNNELEEYSDYYNNKIIQETNEFLLINT